MQNDVRGAIGNYAGFEGMHDNNSDSEEISDGEIIQDGNESFENVLQSFSKEWLHAHLTHNVSLAASNIFWQLSFNFVSKIQSLRASEGINRKIPQFLQVRKNMYTDICPQVHMSFAFLNKNDGSIIHVDANQTPLRQYERDPLYQKLYEEAHIEVIQSRDTTDYLCFYLVSIRISANFM